MMLFRAASGFFPGMLQNHVVIEPQRTAGPVPQEAEAEDLFTAQARAVARSKSHSAGRGALNPAIQHLRTVNDRLGMQRQTIETN
jgi:hypothetical protein